MLKTWTYRRMSTPMDFPSASPVDQLADNASILSLADQPSARQAQPQALLAMTRGNAGKVLRRMDAEYQQENYLWACGMIADEARELLEIIQRKSRSQQR